MKFPNWKPPPLFCTISSSFHLPVQDEASDTTPLKALVYPGLITLLALVIGFTRVFVGVHYPSDILGGAVDGLIAAIVMTLLRYLLKKPTRAVLRFAGNIHLA
jgi:membrane-associated phospholipid phosphatase